jgi:cobalt-zinc-cadmium efflux system outer membrane protein
MQRCSLSRSVVRRISAPVAVLAAFLLLGLAAGRAGAEQRVSSDATPLSLSSTPSLSEYVAYAVEANPDARAALERWRAAAAMVTVAGSLPDPTVSYGYYMDEESRDPVKQTFGVMQMLPWFGKLTLAGSIARIDADVALERYRGSRVSVARDVAAAYWEYAYVERATEITRAQVELLQELEAVVRASYSAGGASYGDLLMAGIELARMTNELETMELMRDPASARLASAVGLRTDVVLPWPAESPEFGQVESFESAWARLEVRNPELRALALEVDAGRRSVHLARREYFPDVSLGVEYMVMDESGMAPAGGEDNTVALMASLSVPLWFGKHRAEVRAATADHLERERMLEAQKNMLASDLRMVLFELGDAVRRVALYEEKLLPMADQSEKTAEAAYRAGTVDFDALITASETLLDFRMSHARAIADRAEKEAELGALVGDDALATTDRPDEPTAPPMENQP